MADALARTPTLAGTLTSYPREISEISQWVETIGFRPGVIPVHRKGRPWEALSSSGAGNARAVRGPAMVTGVEGEVSYGRRLTEIATARPTEARMIPCHTRDSIEIVLLRTRAAEQRGTAAETAQLNEASR